MKSTANVKQPKNESGVEFRWSTSVNQFGLMENDSFMNFHLINRRNSQQKSFPSSSTNVRNFSKGISPLPISPSSPRLPDINKSMKMKKKKLSNSMNDINNGQQSPLLLTYFQLHHAQMSSSMKKKSQAQYSLLPLLNEKQNSMSTHLAFSSESSNQELIISNDEYIRLHTSQLKRLHVSDKYIKEAKKLYFNAASKVFVPRHSIVEIS